MANKPKVQQSAERKSVILERRERVNAVRSAGPRGVEGKEMPELNATAKVRAEQGIERLAAERGETAPAKAKVGKK